MHFIAHFESAVHGFNDDDYARGVEKMLALFKAEDWELSDSLLEKINEDLPNGQSIAWWGSIKKELKKPEFGYFKHQVEALAEESGEELKSYFDRDITAEEIE